MRNIPEDSTLSSRIRLQVERKAEKLFKYHKEGKITILLVEGEGIALFDDSKFLDAIRAAFPDGFPDCVNQIWFADTSSPDNIDFGDFTLDIK